MLKCSQRKPAFISFSDPTPPLIALLEPLGVKVVPSVKIPGNASPPTAVSGSVSPTGCQCSPLILLLLLVFLPSSRFHLWVAVGILLMFYPRGSFFTQLPHYVLLYAFLMIVVNNLLPPLLFPSEIFSDFAE